MLAARLVIRGVDAIVWGTASPAAVTVDAVTMAGARLTREALSEDELRSAEEALWDIWERACWAPEIVRRKKAA